MTIVETLPLIDTKEVQRSLRILLDAGQVVELRALDATSHSSNKYQKPYTASGYFNDPAILTKELSTLKSATGIYITLQPCKTDLIARAQNRLRTASEMNSKKSSATADNHITGYRWLLIDIDQDETIRPAGISASDSEHDAALARCNEVADILNKRFDWPEPVIADSGNGGHLLYRIDLAVTDSTLVKRVLIGLAGLFDTDQLHIDQTVYNPARICKLYGTLACKGDNISDRPHRMSKLLVIPEQIAIVPRKMLEAMAAPEQPKVTQRNSKEWADFNLETWIQDHRLDVTGPAPWNGGDKWVFPMCPWNGEHTDKSAYILRFPSGAIAAGCHHNGCSGLDWKALRTKYEPGAYIRKQKPIIDAQDRTEQMFKLLAGEKESTRPTGCATRCEQASRKRKGGSFDLLSE